MSNLIPPKARKRVKTEYWMRVVSMWMFLIGTAFLMVAALQAPVFILVNDQLEVFTKWYNDVSADHEQFKESEEIIQQANRVNALLNSEGGLLFSELIKEVESVSTGEITIETFAIERKEKSITNFSVTGEAETRSSLANFKNDIESLSTFESAALPLSNLAKDSDIPFNINIAVKAEQ